MASQVTAAGATERTVYLIRHAESRYNEAKKAWNLRGLVGERDHSLSSTGVAQCARLRSALQTAAASGDSDAIAILSPKKTLSSPLCRAILTAHLALPHSGSASPEIVAIPQAREQCMMPVFARDSVGTPRDAINANVASELSAANDSIEMYLAANEDAGSVHHLMKAPVVDLSKIEEEAWWRVGETGASTSDRLQELLAFLFNKTQGIEMTGHGAIVLVAHSRIIRSLFRMFSNESQFSEKLVENCAVIRLALSSRTQLNKADDIAGVHITSAEFLFNSGFR